jgi:hypothetical protein
MTLLFKRSARDDKAPSERFHCPEVILESEGGSGRVVGNPELIFRPKRVHAIWRWVALPSSRGL